MRLAVFLKSQQAKYTKPFDWNYGLMKSRSETLGPHGKSQPSYFPAIAQRMHTKGHVPTQHNTQHNLPVAVPLRTIKAVPMTSNGRYRYHSSGMTSSDMCYSAQCNLMKLSLPCRSGNTQGYSALWGERIEVIYLDFLPAQQDLYTIFTVFKRPISLAMSD
jgi:hypothetical protein